MRTEGAVAAHVVPGSVAISYGGTQSTQLLRQLQQCGFVRERMESPQTARNSQAKERHHYDQDPGNDATRTLLPALVRLSLLFGRSGCRITLHP